MKQNWRRNASLILALLFLCGVSTYAEDGPKFSARLLGFQEVPPKLTQGFGSFRAVVDVDAKTISYTLTFSNLSSNAVASHIHFGQPAVNGGIFINLCGTSNTPVCPAGGGTVTGTIIAADVLAGPTQNVTAGDFDGALRIIKSGTAYVNVHTVNFAGGEIRGQVKFGDEAESDRHEAREHTH